MSEILFRPDLAIRLADALRDKEDRIKPGISVEFSRWDGDINCYTFTENTPGINRCGKRFFVVSPYGEYVAIPAGRSVDDFMNTLRRTGLSRLSSGNKLEIDL